MVMFLKDIMSIREARLILAVGVVLLIGNAMASDAKIHITGAVVAQSCTAQPTVQNLTLPNVTQGDVKDSRGTGVSSILKIPVTCTGATATKGKSVTMSLLPAVTDVSGSGEVLLNKATGDKAEGVGVSLLDQNGNLLIFNNGTPAEVHASLNGDAGDVILAAKYAKDGSNKAVTAGSVEVNVPFVLTYK